METAQITHTHIHTHFSCSGTLAPLYSWPSFERIYIYHFICICITSIKVSVYRFPHFSQSGIMAKACARRNLWPKTNNMNRMKSSHKIHKHQDKLCFSLTCSRSRSFALEKLRKMSVSDQTPTSMDTYIYEIHLNLLLNIECDDAFAIFATDSLCFNVSSCSGERLLWGEIFIVMRYQKCMTLICRYSNVLWSNSNVVLGVFVCVWNGQPRIHLTIKMNS